MLDLIDKLRLKLNIPGKYKAYTLNPIVWNRFEKKATKCFWERINISNTLLKLEKYGFYKGKDFIITKFNFDEEDDMNTIVFTESIDKFYNEFFKKKPPTKIRFPTPFGVYKLIKTSSGIKLDDVEISHIEEPILNNNLNETLKKEINNFLDKENLYKKMKLEYKRGILLYGPPGNGKTSFIKSFIRKQKYISILINIKDDDELDFLKDYLEEDIDDKVLKLIIIEDIDGIGQYQRSQILNLLDGISRMYKVMFVATTNYPNKLDIGIKKRPSRFDTMIEITYPNKTTRTVLLKKFFPELKNRVLDDCVEASKRFSGAYFKEIFLFSQLNSLPPLDAILEIKKRLELFSKADNDNYIQ